MAFNPNAVFISPSSIADFKTCPQLYYYRNVYRSPKTGLKITLVNPKLALGQAVHSTLHRFLFGSLASKSQEQLTAVFNTLWADYTGEKGGFSTNEEEIQIKERGYKMLQRFWNNEHFRSVCPIKIADFPKLELGDDIILTGLLDWVEKEEDGTCHIVDFKTGESEARSDSVQLPVYAVLASGYLKTKNLKASYWYLDKDEILQDYKLPDLEETKTNLQKLGLIIKMARQTSSFSCPSGLGSCWACRDFKEIVAGKGRLVAVDSVRKQEIYIVKSQVEEDQPVEQSVSDLPF